MNTYEITTNHGILTAEGTHFKSDHYPQSGEVLWYTVNNEDGPVLIIRPDEFLSCTVQPSARDGDTYEALDVDLVLSKMTAEQAKRDALYQK